jgi:transcription-repair coupling factor (superfamily II helicase)
MRLSHLHTRLESILDRYFVHSQSAIEIIGPSSPFALSHFLAHSLSKNINNLPHLVVVPSLEDAHSFKKQLEAFHSPFKSHILTHYDVSPYSTLLPNENLGRDRLNFYFKAQNARPGEIFICPVRSLLQKCVPFSYLRKKILTLNEGDEISNDFSRTLLSLGYSSCPLAEDQGQFALRGGIIDVFSPAHDLPFRIELFGDMIETIRFFSPDNQRTTQHVQQVSIIPAHEVLYEDESLENVLLQYRKSLEGREVYPEEVEEILRSLTRKNYFPGIDFLLPYFFEKLESPLDHFSSALNIWFFDPMSLMRESDQFFATIKQDFESSTSMAIRPPYLNLFSPFESLHFPDESRFIKFNRIRLDDQIESNTQIVEYKTGPVNDLSDILVDVQLGPDERLNGGSVKLNYWKTDGYRIFIFARNHQQSERVKIAVVKMGFSPVITQETEFLIDEWVHQQDKDQKLIHILPFYNDESLRFYDEKIIYLRDEDFFGKKSRLKSSQAQKDFQKQAEKLNFGELNPGDFIVHIKHGVGQYEGLKLMAVNGVESEYLQLAYRDKDKLYLPVYRVGQIQKYSTGSANVSLDKLGGTNWEKVKVKVKSHLKDIASELLHLYAQRAQMHRPPYSKIDNDFSSFEAAFPYDETEDQLKAISDTIADMLKPQPMDRLICGDVGFGKTEVAMRASFKCVQDRKQVAVLAPTTVLSFQHVETFKKRFKGWPIVIKELNRFVSNSDAKKTLAELREGRVDIVIGTHRVFSKDVVFKNLGLLVVDEEQRFGVTHKERIKKLKSSVDTLTLSATPIPRTLNMSLVGIRDLSFITTPPVDRLPTRTFTCKFEPETIRKAILSEIQRGGQIYFIHNRVQSIYSILEELRLIAPEARIRVGHGQMNEGELEATMIAFFNHEIDVLLCTTIVESGMDVSRANTMFIDNAHQLGLSQLYQLRGRVGRSKHRAYCYLIIPRGKTIDKDAQERLRVIQENVALGSGLRIAQHDLEMRGAGNILGEEQSGHVNLVGYDLYMDLLNEALSEAKGEDSTDNIELDPEINLKIPALIPDKYIPDIRLRLSYYKMLSNIHNQDELSDIEDELKDQFGPLPEQVLNLMGLMLLRLSCRQLGVKDLSTGLKTITLSFTERTKLKPEVAIGLAMRENKKYSLTPDSRLIIRLSDQTISKIYDELDYLMKISRH